MHPCFGLLRRLAIPLRSPRFAGGPRPGSSRRAPWPCAAHGLHLQCSRSRVAIPGDLNMQRKASARWQGTLKEGNGSISTQSGALSDAPYGFNTRFADGKGTNPEELIGAAHAGCFTMALSFALNNAGFTAEAIDT